MLTTQLFKVFVQIVPKDSDEFDYFNLELIVPMIPVIGDSISFLGISEEDKDHYSCKNMSVDKLENWKHLFGRHITIIRRQIDIDTNNIWLDAMID